MFALLGYACSGHTVSILFSFRGNVKFPEIVLGLGFLAFGVKYVTSDFCFRRFILHAIELFIKKCLNETIPITVNAKYNNTHRTK